MIALLRAELRAVLRTPSFVIGNLVMPSGMCVLVGTRITGGDGAVSALGKFTMAIAIFSAVGVALTTCGVRLGAEREAGWTTQLALLPVTRRSWLAAKIITCAVATFVPLVVVTCLVSVMTGRVGPPGHLALAVLTAWVCVQVLSLFGLCLGLSLSGDLVGLAAIVAHLVLSVVGGLLWPPSYFPGWLHALTVLTPTYHVDQAAVAVQGGALPHLGDLLVLLGYLLVAVAWLAFVCRVRRGAREVADGRLQLVPA